MIRSLPRRWRGVLQVALIAFVFLILMALLKGNIPALVNTGKAKDAVHHKFRKPEPKNLQPPIPDPFPMLQHSKPPAPPIWNMAKPNVHQKYNLPVPPPLVIGFTRNWPVLLQCVASYITAGWPAEQIFVVENTGVQQANKQGKLTLQNPFYLNHTQLGMLGVTIIQTPVLLNFAQLQNFFLAQTHEKDWPYFFWTHADTLAFSWEDGRDGRPKYNEPEYRTLYEHAMEGLQDARDNDPMWAARFYAYDHLTAINPVAYEAIGGWDSFIPYYTSDCDFYRRLSMNNYTVRDRSAGAFFDISTVFRDLAALYRVPDADVGLVDLNPGGKSHEDTKKRRRRSLDPGSSEEKDKREERDEDTYLAYYYRLTDVGAEMLRYKSRGRNVWQAAQRGGQGEPFYYPSEGIADAIDILDHAGKEVFAKKWGHKSCEIHEIGRVPEDAWMLEKDWWFNFFR